MKIPGLGLRITDWRPVLGGGTPPAPGQAIIDAIEATDAGAQSAPVKAAINDFIASLQSGALWSKMVGLWGFVGGTADSHAINWKDFTVGTYSGVGITHNSNGITGDGTNWFDTGLTNNLNPDSITLGAYSRTNSDGLYDDMGASNLAPPSQLEYITRLSNTAYFDMVLPAEVSVASTDSRGLFAMSRAVPGTLRAYRNGAEIGNTAAASSSMIAVNFAILSGSTTFVYRQSPRNLSFAFVSTGLTPTEHSDLYTAVQDLQTALSRQV